MTTKNPSPSHEAIPGAHSPSPVKRTPIDQLTSTILRPSSIEQSTQPRPPESPSRGVAATGSSILLIGNYEILAEIARGGMGVVYKARQRGVNRIVALKMTLAGQFAGVEERRRFQAEVEAAGRLDHPNIVPIYEVSEHAGQPYFSMGYVEGQSLKGLLVDGPLPPHRAAELMKAIAEAVHYAHTKGIIHRDLKPANVLIDVSGEPRVTDFGLAKQATTDSSLTATGQILGTPSFMPPEQAMGMIDQIGPESDVYSLGAMLYNLVTGRPPFQAAAVVDILLQVKQQEPVSPRTLNPAVPRDLETICLKCLRKEPFKRYLTAAELSDDLERWMENKPIRGRPVGRVERLWLWCRRKPAVAGLSMGVAMLLVVGTVSGLIIRSRVEQQRNAAHAAGLVTRLLDAETSLVPTIIGEMSDLRQWTDSLLRQEFDSAPDGRRKLHASLGLLPVDDRQREYLVAQLLDAAPHEVAVLRDALEPHQSALAEALWAVAEHPGEGQKRRRLRAASALAKYEPASERWDGVRDAIANDLVGVPTVHLALWIECLRPVRDRLLAPLSAIFRDAGRSVGERSLATDILAEYAADRPDVLADLVMDADQMQFAILVLKLKDVSAAAVSPLEVEMTKQPASDASEAEKDALSQRQANAGAALLKLKRPRNVWPLLAHSPDPRARTWLIHRIAPLGVDPQILITRLEQELDVSIRRALILSLGEFLLSQLPEAQRQPLISQLIGIYKSDPDPGLHSAVEWLLRKWNLQDALAKAVHELKSKSEPESGRISVDSRRWYINTEGQTMAIVTAESFKMGSDGSPPDVSQSLHPVRIDRTFAIGTKEVTRGQYARFLNDTSPNAPKTPEQFSPTEDSPQIAVTWYDATRYCNWLSQAAGMSKDDWCYEPNAEGKYVQGMKPAADYLKRRGYRLPTEAEWEYACRAGTSTSRFYGSSDALLDRYAWYFPKGKEFSIRWVHPVSPVGQLKPNDLGLFDQYGNAAEWCDDIHRDYPKGLFKDLGTNEPVLNSAFRVSRGSKISFPPETISSAGRFFGSPQGATTHNGFRVARTLH